MTIKVTPIDKIDLIIELFNGGDLEQALNYYQPIKSILKWKN